MSNTKNNFAFNEHNQATAQVIIAKYPAGRQKSAILALLDIAQRQNGGWLSTAAIEHVAAIISEPFIRVYEVATFYTMFNLRPIGRYHLQVCGTTPCWLNGAHDVIKSCKQYASITDGDSSADGLFTISEVECLGACVGAPVMQINDDFYENLSDAKIKRIIEQLKQDHSANTNRKKRNRNNKITTA